MSIPTKYAIAMDRADYDGELRDVDEQILDRLEQYPSTRQHLAERLDKSGEYIYQRVDLLSKLGLVAKIHDGYYERAGWRAERGYVDDEEDTDQC